MIESAAKSGAENSANCALRVAESQPSELGSERKFSLASIEFPLCVAAGKPPAKPPPKTKPILPDDDGVAVLERVPQKVGPPQMFQVLMLNDDYTPMEFVVVVLQEFFHKDREQATQIMLKIHLDGKGVCGVYSKDVASTKVNLVLDAAKQAGHPLQCVSEPVK
jgi:ATP-dependent Clp protease adaptor protein ClpS